MMGDVVAVAVDRVAGGDLRHDRAADQPRRHQGRKHLVDGVALHQFEEIIDAALLHDEAAIHEKLAKLQRRVGGQFRLGRRVRQPDTHCRPPTIAIDDRFARGINDRQVSLADDATDQTTQIQ